MTGAEEHLTVALDRLRRATDKARLYGVTHPEARAAIDSVWEPLSEALTLAAPITLAAGLDGLSWQGNVLVAEDEDHDGLGRLLHREGIASITFHGSTDRDELEKVLDIVRVNLALPEHEEDTLEALLWQAHFDGVTFTVVAELMDAESVSGDVARYLDRRGAVGDKARRALAEMLAQAMLRTSKFEVADGDDSVWDETDEAWALRFDEDLAEDAPAVSRMRSEIASEKPGHQIGRTVQMLLRVARGREADLPPEQAIQLVRTAITDVVDQHDTSALAQLVGVSRHALEVETDPRVRGLIEGVVKMATDPYLAARLLAAAGTNADTAARDQLVGMLDDAGILALIEWSFPQEGDPRDGVERGRWLAIALGEETAQKARRWLADDHAPPRLSVPAAQLLRGRDLPGDRALRPTLLKHAVTRVQDVVLDWYAETGVPPSDMYHMLARLEDPRRRTRRSTWAVLARHPPPDIGRWFRARLNPKTLIDLPEDLQVDLCVGCGRIVGAKALPILDEVMDRRVGIFVNARETALLRAAAMGIAAIETTEALALLEGRSKSWSGARAAACKTALERLHAGKL